MRRMHIRRPLALGMAAPLLFLVLGCAPVDSSSTDAEEAPAPTESTSESAPPEADPAACAADKVRTPGTLTIGTDSPAYDPWFSKNDPTNGEGFESAVAYAVAERLGLTPDAVTWTKVPFNSSYAPGPKKFDFDINQISITAARAKVVDFSDGYYQASQGVIMLKGDNAEGVTTVAQLKTLKLGAQTGTTSLTAIRDVIQPDSEPVVFKDTSAAKQALLNGQVDAILADLPTAFYITAVEIPKGTIVGQFQPETGEQEEFGMLFEKGSPLVECVNQALDALKEDGTLDSIEQQWLSDVVDVPELTP